MMARRARVRAAIAVAALASLSMGAPSASASSLPFSDTDASGYIGFCDQSGHQITSGKIGAAPFVWRAVSSVPAPSGFEPPTGKAVLNAYQPRQGVDPGDWSGKQMTATSTFTNGAHPMVAATGLDPALVDFVSVFQPKWDGLVQLRMYFSAANRPPYSIPYPATVVKVSGDNWKTVTPGNVDCTAGSATSVEVLSLPTKILDAPTARITKGAPGPAGKTAKTSAAGSSDSGAAVASSGSSSGPSGVGLQNAAAARTSDDSSGAGIALLAIAGAVVVGTTGLLGYRRRRRHS